MKQTKMKKKKKKRSRISETGNGEKDEDQKIMKNLLEAFGGVSVEEVAAACREANGNPDKAAEILASSAALGDQSTTCSSSNGNFDVGSSSSSNGNNDAVPNSISSNGSLAFRDAIANDLVQEKKGKPKMKKVIASAGMVSNVMGKDYMRSTPKRGLTKLKGFHGENWREEAEQFLCSMLGDDCELSLAVVSDVLGQCGYNVNEALDILLELSSSSKDQSNGLSESRSRDDTRHIAQSYDHLTDGSSDSTSRSSDNELQDNIWFNGNHVRNLSKISLSRESHQLTETGNSELELPQKVLESLFNMPTPKSVEHEPGTMNWRNIVKQLTSLGPKFEPPNNEQPFLIEDKGDEYHVHREAARQHWDSMKSYYHKAAVAFSNGERANAAHLSGQGRLQSKLAREADEKASQDIFAARNKAIENMITIDLHGQHVKPAMKLLKLHLLFGAYVRSVRSFRVITGCGSHGVGKSKLKNSVVNLLQKEGIAWTEENRGTLLIKLAGQTNFSFLDSDSGSNTD